MKKIAFLAVMIALLVGATATRTQAQTTLNYPWAAADYQSVTATNDSIQFTVSNTLTLVTSTIDTTTVVKATVGSHIKNGAVIHLKITAPSTANQTISWSGLTAASATITKAKTSIYTFVYFYDGFKLISTQQIN